LAGELEFLKKLVNDTEKRKESLSFGGKSDEKAAGK